MPAVTRSRRCPTTGPAGLSATALDNGKAAEVLWHFLPNADGTQDIPQDLLDCLREKQILFKIYPSNGSFYG